ncbi:penicillin-binding transpeptidase domain-containing protein [Corynebacterium diphtheriae]|uniref:penicillin-binding transpeptidase domain-containing protein n=1 Tax=Corynebacterium diphtheriae TaxID=1717 RepID=UPI00038F74D8|nr:penicillin-binding transpeptidase domain-containing protein [Corynebacterium diphtheriae]ERA51285.1 putative secreted penicillin-binding protein 2 [Corynebacterium diphtheriae str. Aberdeen]KLN45440.1 penicillin-binding protein A [Corynebacterium diphtheriae bv. gravis str. ISS 4749]MBG9379743.1 penicillin-binding protein 2 [Corynebacterium diphtheriae bv. gravis]CAB0741494.1 penicillin-binding protein 2 [Corynebacterium diphtheriae]
MNRSIRFTSVFALLLILILLVNLTIIQGFSQEKYAHNALNRRGFIELKSQARGQISTGGQVLAESYQDEEGFYQRRYVTNPAIYGPIEGYLSDIYGASGMESNLNGVLSGTDSSVSVRRWTDELLGRKHSGANVELTLLPQVQEVAYNQMANAGYEGAVVAIKPSTGEILAMASTPSYDPSAIVNPDTAEQTWAALNANPGNPLLNHATQETLPPGSTFKVITTAAGLNAGYGPGSMLTGQDRITLPDGITTLENYAGQTCAGSQNVTLATAFQYSCNTAFVQMGIDVGQEKFDEAAHAFGVNDRYDLGVVMAPGTIGDVSDPSARGQSSIGQRDVAMSVLHNAVVAATVANGGKRMEPHLVSRIVGQDLKVIKETKPHQINEAVTPEVAATLTDLMRLSERHTAGYTGADIASKTGTAEHGEDSRNSNPHAWYIAFGPSANADVAVAVVVKNGGDAGQAATGGSVAAPIGRAVIAAAQAALAARG